MQSFGNIKNKHFSATQREVPQCELWGRIDQGDDHVQVSSYYYHLLLSISAAQLCTISQSKTQYEKVMVFQQ